MVRETHPLFGRLVRASSFKRLNGVLHLVVVLPDGSPGTVQAEATDVLGVERAEGLAVVLDAEGLRALRELVARLGRDGPGRRLGRASGVSGAGR